MGNKALLVGINKYRLPGSDLKGCLNDVTNMRHMLLTYLGFNVEDIRVVVDERATRTAIMERLEWLAEGAQPGDRLVFHYSGHGSQIRDRHGDELKDRMDEILCPHDMDWDGNYIIDDDIAAVFSGIPEGTNLDIFLDSCHSGNGTRDIFAVADSSIGIIGRDRFLNPPVDILCREKDNLPVNKLLGGNPSPINHVLFAACRENQTSADAMIAGFYNGAFTYFLCKHMRDANAELTRSDLLKRVRSSLHFNKFDQVPQLECESGKLKKRILE